MRVKNELTVKSKSVQKRNRSWNQCQTFFENGIEVKNRNRNRNRVLKKGGIEIEIEVEKRNRNWNRNRTSKKSGIEIVKTAPRPYKWQKSCIVVNDNFRTHNFCIRSSRYSFTLKAPLNALGRNSVKTTS